MGAGIGCRDCGHMAVQKSASMDQGFDVYCGLDVGKSEHHATALSRAGARLFDKPLPQDEARLRELFTTLQRHGKVLMVLYQPNTIGALPVAAAQDCGCEVTYQPGLAMRKAAGLDPGNSKTDARDAFIIAETARVMPHTLRAVDRDSEVLSALKVLSGFHADLTHECTRAINRLRSLLLQIFPALERAFPGTVLTRPPVLELLVKYAGPTGIRGEFPARSGNKQLKNALFRSAWIASCHDPLSKAYYDRKRAQGKKHNAAVICLARRRCDVIFAMLKNGTLCKEKTPQVA
jgi:transposase